MITRDEFRKVWSETIRNTDRVLDLIEQGYEGYRFKMWYYDSEAYILNKKEGILINWYKISHIGRCLFISHDISLEKLIEMFNELIDELDEEA